MFATNVVVALVTLFVPLLVRAEVGPTVPAPGDIYNPGSLCPIAWTGDPNSTTAWKNMTIQLMTGSNLDMQIITVVATGQDGTVSGQFSYTCPQVTPNSAIYFYQFSSSGTSDLAWTGRFAIASSSGQTTPPQNATQPDGTSFPWGIGQLVNSSATVASSTGSSISNSTSSILSATAQSNPTSGASPTSISAALLSASGSKPSTVVTSQSVQSTSGALDAMTGFDIRVLGAALALSLSFVW